MTPQTFSVQTYTADDWRPLWRLHFAHLAERGIPLTDNDIPPVPGMPENDTYEWDLNHIDEVYLSGGGSFWIAWEGDEPVGFVGAQDLGGVAELRRMYVRAAHRRRGIGPLLVQALIAHCRSSGIRAVELWTSEADVGRKLYAHFGFQPVEQPELGFELVETATHHAPNADEIRMRLVL